MEFRPFRPNIHGNYALARLKMQPAPDHSA